MDANFLPSFLPSESPSGRGPHDGMPWWVGEYLTPEHHR